MSGIIKKIFKLVGYLLLVLVIFVAAVTGIFVATFDANEYKEDLQNLVREQTGRELEFYGDVGLTIYPSLGMKLGALSFSNAKGFGEQPMVKVNEVSISVDVASLISLAPEVEQLVLRDLEINLAKNKKGVTNWDDLVKENGKATSATTSETESSDGEALQLRGAFGGLNIQNARLIWKDEQAGAEYRVNDLDLTTGRITPDSPFALAVHVMMQSGDEIDASLDLKSDVQYLLNDKKLQLSNLSLDMDASGSQIPFQPTKIGFDSESITIDLNANSIDLQGLQLALNELEFEGQVKVSDYTKSAVSFELAADTLDVDALLGTPPPGSESPVRDPEPVKTGSAEDVEIKLPMELMRTLDIDGSLTIAKLKLQNLWMQNVELGVKAKDGVLDLDPLKMMLYDGSFDGAVQINTKGRKPVYTARKTFRDVQVGQLLTDFSGEDKISGTMNTSVQVTTSGEWLSSLKKNSNGKMALAFTDGAVKGFNLRYMLDSAKAKLKGEKTPEEEAEKTDFSALGLSGKITNGVFTSDDLDLQAPALRIGGEGKANLTNDTVDYLVKAKLVGTLKGQEAGSQDELGGLLIPVRIKGPFTDPKFDIQIDEMLKVQSDAKIAEEKAKIKAQLEAEKAALEKQIEEEKAALEIAKQRELEKQKAVLEAKKKAAKEKAKKKAEDKLKKLLE